MEVARQGVIRKKSLFPPGSNSPITKSWLKVDWDTRTWPKGTLGSLSKHDDDNAKKQSVLCAKQQLCTDITLFSTFLWRPLHDYDAKPSIANIRRLIFFFFFWTLIRSLRIQLHKKIAYFWQIKRVQIDAKKFERTQIHFFIDLFAPVVVVVIA